MEKCKRLSDYAYFVQAVRDYIVQGYTIEEAVIQAVDECIRKDILADKYNLSPEKADRIIEQVWGAGKHE